MLTFSVAIDTSKMNKMADKLKKQLRNFKSSLRSIAGPGTVDTQDGYDFSIADRIHYQFQSEGSFFGTKWKLLAPRTLAWRRRIGKPYPAYPILSVTGTLKSSLTTKEATLKLGSTELVYGTKVPYAKSHHFGYAPRGLPRRELFVVDDDMRRMMALKILKDITSAMRSS